PGRPWRHRLPLLHHEPGRPGLRDLPPAGPAPRREGSGVMSNPASTLRQLASERILVLDGAMGTMIQALGLDEEGYRGPPFDACNRDRPPNPHPLPLTQ